MQKTIFKYLCLFLLIAGTGLSHLTFAAETSNVKVPNLNCFGLPGCGDTDKTTPSAYNPSETRALTFISVIIAEGIKYVAVIAVFTLILSGMMYILANGEDKNVDKAKKWITWSLVGVFVSISAWGIINLLNTFKL